jgi:hypothetical protein
MQTTKTMSCLAVATATAMASLGSAGCETLTSAPDAEVIELGLENWATDGAVLRTIAVTAAPGEVKRFRVTTDAFRATLDQTTSEPAQLSAKHYEYDHAGVVSVSPTVDAVADGTERAWTLRLANLGTGTLTGTLTVAHLVASPAPPVDEGGGYELGAELRRQAVAVDAGTTKTLKVSAVALRAALTQAGQVPARLSAKNYTYDLYGETGVSPTVDAVADATLRYWTLRIQNLGTETLTGEVVVWELLQKAAPEPDPEPDQPPFVPGPIPTLADPVQAHNTWCTYQATAPYVKTVAWEHPDVQAAMRGLALGYRSIISYAQWKVPFGLEAEPSTATPERLAAIRARNYVRALCGEHRDQPSMIAAKLAVLAQATTYAGPGELEAVDTSKNLMAQLTYPAYERMVAVMGAVYGHRRAALADPNDGYHYGYGRTEWTSRRVERSVAPWTHCEMKFMFTHYLLAGSPSISAGSSFAEIQAYETAYAAYRAAECTADDLAWMYNFRGHVNFHPLWLESNGFVQNARRARGAELSRGARDYYLHPFASRHAAARAAWGTYLLYPDADHAKMIQASDAGGGPILYVTDQDTDHDGLADYRLFDEFGCGDQGVSSSVPSENCNMVTWGTAFYAKNTTGHAAAWDPTWITTPDLGFLSSFTTFEARMGRLNQAIDRHTNWGPTGYYQIDASDPGDFSPRFFGAYSPIVAASYEISASDWFAKRDYTTSDPWEAGRTKWMYFMRFRAEHYYDEARLKAGDPLDFTRHYLNETSLSNDYYGERALDHFGWIPEGEIHAVVYLAYGDRGEAPPAPASVGAP